MIYDASALLALVLDETGSEETLRHLGDGAISAVNLAEVMSTLAQRGATADDLDALLADLPLKVLPFGSDEAKQAALLRPLTLANGLSLGDRACLAVAILQDARALSADRAWAALPRDIADRVDLIR